MAKLPASQIETALKNLDGWNSTDGDIRKEFKFADFIEAMVFVNNVAELAEEAGHHPDIDIRYNKVVLALVTHDEGGVTAKDVELARQIEAL